MIGRKLLDTKEKFQEEAFDLNFDLADNPELPSQEFRSSKKIIQILKKHGIKVEEKPLDIETAFIGKVVSKEESNINIGILMEYDALPSVGHACGHSLSAAISLLSALCIKENEDIINANIDVIGTPDEEDAGLKVPMANAGLFDKYDAVIMVHVGSQYSVPNWRLLAIETHEITFEGRESHTAVAPWEGRSALDGLMLSIHAIDMMRKMMKPRTIIEGYIQEGGVNTNIIPGKARAKFTFRSSDIEDLQNCIREWFKDILEGCSLATQTKYTDKIFDYPFKDMLYNEFGTNIIKEVMEENGIIYKESTEAEGSSDIGDVSYRCPAFHPSIAITEEYVALHTPKIVEIVKSEKSKEPILNGANVILGFISKLLDNPDFIKRIREEFERNSRNAKK